MGGGVQVLNFFFVVVLKCLFENKCESVEVIIFQDVLADENSTERSGLSVCLVLVLFLRRGGITLKSHYVQNSFTLCTLLYGVV